MANSRCEPREELTACATTRGQLQERLILYALVLRDPTYNYPRRPGKSKTMTALPADILEFRASLNWPKGFGDTMPSLLNTVHTNKNDILF